MERKLREMVDEDLWLRDLTLAFTPNRKVKAEIKAKESCIVSGIRYVKALLDMFNIKILESVVDGSNAGNGDRIFLLEGNSHDILVVERTILDILSRISGISTLTREYVEKAGNVRIAATRKTTPLFGFFEKEAVRIAGGDTHRLGLYDSVLIKDNHLKLFSSVGEAIKKAKEKTSFVHKIEVEVSSAEEAVEAAEAGADIILLDNMKPADIIDTIKKLKGKKPVLEASGNITLENLEEYANTGVDVISVGALTHSAPGKDFSLEIL